MSFSLEAIFGVDTSGVKAELKSLRRDLNSFVEDYAKLGAGVAVGAFVAMSKGAIDLAGNLSDTAQNIGINVESLQALEAQHKRNGVSNEELTKALQKTKAAVIAAAEGDEKAIAALDKLGLSAKDLIKLPLDEQYTKIAQGAKGAADEAEAYSAVTSLLGEKVGPKLMSSLRELAEEGLPGVMDSARKAGQVMSAETIVALDKAGDAIDDFKRWATIAVGDIIVNFRTADGVLLLGEKLMKVAAEFGGTILDFFTEAGSLSYAVLKGSFKGVLNYLQDGFVTVVEGIAGLINKILPAKFEINVGNLEEFRSSGKGISDEISEAIAKTSPSTFKKDFGDAWQSVIDDQQKTVDALNDIDLGDEADKLRHAGDAAKTSLGDGAKVVAAAGVEVEDSIKEGAQAILKASQDLMVAVYRTGPAYSDQSDDALIGIRNRLRSQKQEAELDTSYSSAFTPGMKSPMVGLFANELNSVEKELGQRAEIRQFTSRYGASAAVQQFGDTAYQKAMRDLQSTNQRSMTALERIERGLTAIGLLPNG